MIWSQEHMYKTSYDKFHNSAFDISKKPIMVDSLENMQTGTASHFAQPGTHLQLRRVHILPTQVNLSQSKVVNNDVDLCASNPESNSSVFAQFQSHRIRQKPTNERFTHVQLRYFRQPFRSILFRIWQQVQQTKINPSKTLSKTKKTKIENS